MAERAEPQPVDPARKPVGPSTLAVHGGEVRPKPAHSLTTPIVQTATYTFANTQELKDHFDGKIERVEYGRYGNPTQRVAELKLAALEGAGECLLFASGMGAMTTALFAMLSRGTHVVVTDDSYRRTRQFLNQTLSRYGIEVSTVPAGDYDALEDAIRPTTRVLVSESPTNPYNRILDLERFAAIGRRHRNGVRRRPRRVRIRPRVGPGLQLIGSERHCCRLHHTREQSIGQPGHRVLLEQHRRHAAQRGNENDRSRAVPADPDHDCRAARRRLSRIPAPVHSAITSGKRTGWPASSRSARAIRPCSSSPAASRT